MPLRSQDIRRNRGSRDCHYPNRGHGEHSDSCGRLFHYAAAARDPRHMSDDEEPKPESPGENAAVNPAAEQTPAESRACEKDRLQPPIGKRQEKEGEREERRAPRPDDADVADAEEEDMPIRRGGDHTRVRRAIRSELDLDRGPEPPEPASTMEYSAMNIVALDHVFLAFDQPILEDVSFTAKAGETVAVLGESGTGKS